MSSKHKIDVQQTRLTDIFFGMYSDGKEGGSDGKEGCRDGGHCNRSFLSEDKNLLHSLDYQF